jgi:YfiH family protein
LPAKANLYHFNLQFDEKLNAAFFCFFVDGSPVQGIRCGISSRLAGDMKIGKSETRSAFFRSLGIEPSRVFGLKQIHSKNVFAVPAGKNAEEFEIEGDGLASFADDAVLSVTVADCLPVFLFAPETGAFAAVHSGWKGTGIAGKALEVMQCRPETAAAVLGPCIQNCCYRVDEERAAIFAAEFGKESVRKSGGAFFLDLQAANIALLEKAGLRHIAVCGDCTFTDERLGSFRREGAGYTRMAALVGHF